MRKIKLFLMLGLLTVTSTALPLTTSTTQQTTQNTGSNKNLQAARTGCQKPLGFFPTPSKLYCMLTAFGITEKEAKPKALAVVFNVCHGRLLQAQPPTGFTPKRYPNLASCLKDPQAVNLINTELKAEGFPAVKVVNEGVLST